MTSTKRTLITMIAFVVVLGPLSAVPIPATPVVVELFESQGCSSCPPAERVMERLRSEFGARVILLTFHVDYWDSLGWKDPFSDPRWTERQNGYAQRFQQNSMYTPEMVVQGRDGFVGSDLSQARSAVQRAVSESRLAFTLKVGRKTSDATVTVQCSPLLAAQVHDLLAMRVEEALPVHVLRGENSGTTMSGDNAVRDLTPMPALAGGKSSVHMPVPGSITAVTHIVVLAFNTHGDIVAAESETLP